MIFLKNNIKLDPPVSLIGQKFIRIAVSTTQFYRLIQAFATTQTTMKSIKPAEITVVVIASHLDLSKTTPKMPKTNDSGSENNMNNPARTGRGLPQPGLSMRIVRTTAPTIARKTIESFPKSIFYAIRKTS